MRIKIEGKIPSVNSIWKKSRKGGVYLSKEADEFKQAIGWIAVSQRIKPLSGSIKIYVEWHCKKGGRGDLDNRMKVIQDWLNWIAYKDDSQIKEIHALKIENSTFDGAIIEVKEL